MNDKLMQFLVIVSTVVMIALNGLAATGGLGGANTRDVSDAYPTPITPKPYAFAIWSVIYIGIILFTIFQSLPAKRETFRSIRVVYLASCAANALWLYVWALSLATPSLLILCQVLIMALLVTLGMINFRLQKPGTAGDYWLVRAPFGIYFGWVTAATLLNLIVTIKALRPEWLMPETQGDYIGALFVVIAGVAGVVIRFLNKNYFYPLAVAWASLTIALGHSSQKAVMFSAVGAVVVCLIAAGLFVIDMKGYEPERA